MFTSFDLRLCFIQACGHRWKNIFYIKNENKLPTGVCYGMPPDLRTELSKRIAPCYQGKESFWYYPDQEKQVNAFNIFFTFNFVYAERGEEILLK